MKIEFPQLSPELIDAIGRLVAALDAHPLGAALFLLLVCSFVWLPRR